MRSAHDESKQKTEHDAVSAPALAFNRNQFCRVNKKKINDYGNGDNEKNEKYTKSEQIARPTTTFTSTSMKNTMQRKRRHNEFITEMSGPRSPPCARHCSDVSIRIGSRPYIPIACRRSVRWQFAVRRHPSIRRIELMALPICLCDFVKSNHYYVMCHLMDAPHMRSRSMFIIRAIETTMI